MNNITRIYPIRKTTKEWNIPLYCSHICDEKCSKMYIQTSEETTEEHNIYTYSITDNPTYIDGKCNLFNKLEQTYIDIENYDKVDPQGINGPLYNPNEIVIPDKSFILNITFPLSNTIEVKINSLTNGMTLNQLIHCIKMLYIFIYDEEEYSSTEQTFNIQTDCKCSNIKHTDYLEDFVETPDNDCSICYNNYNEYKPSKLKCNHVFHTECISKWLNTSHTCPLCRQSIISCQLCNNTKIINMEYTGVVIPYEFRNEILNRNTTDGTFGIWGYDLRDLMIENLHYNRIKNILTMNIGV